MLPGFNISNDNFMAYEGFTSGKSSDAFTASDLEEFQDALQNGADNEKFADTVNNTTDNEYANMSKKELISELLQCHSKLQDLRKASTTRATPSTTRATPSTPVSEEDEDSPVTTQYVSKSNNKRNNKTSPFADADITEFGGDNEEKTLETEGKMAEGDGEMDGEMDGEDGEMAEEDGESTQSISANANMSSNNVSSESEEDMTEGTDDNMNSGKEGFTGSKVYLNNTWRLLLKSVLLALCFFVLSNARTYNLTSIIVKGLGLPKELVHSIVFLLVSYLVLSVL